MNERRPQHGPGDGAVPRVASEWWTRGAVAGTVIVCVFIVWIQVTQERRGREAFAGVRELREARLDLSKGFMHLTQSDAPDSPYSREQGLALLRQAVRRMERQFAPADVERARVFAAKVADLGARMEERTTRDERGVRAELRMAFYQVEREAEVLDAHLQTRLAALSARNRREFLLVTGCAAALLAMFCAGVLRVQGARLRAERELRLREARFRRLNESLPQLIWTWDARGSCDYLSHRWGDYTGQDSSEHLGDGWMGAIKPEDREIFLRVSRAAMQGGIEFHVQIRLRRHDGDYRWFDMRVLPLHDGAGVVTQWLGSATDIQSERELREAAEQERAFSDSMIDSLPGVFYLYDLRGKFLRWNRNFERATGYSGEEISRMHPLDFFEGEDRARVEERIGEVFALGESSVEAEFRAKNGVLAPYYFTGIKTELNGQPCLIGVGIDITKRKQAEAAVRALNETLEHRVEQRTKELQAKNRELETFTYSVSHDLKAPLRGIDGYSRLLLEDYSDKLDDEGRRFLESVRQASVQMGQLIDDLLAYSQLERRAIAMVALKPKAVVDALPVSYADEIRDRGVALTVALPDVAVMADANGLAQVLRNLLDNALKFTRGTPAPAIEIAGRVEGEKMILWVKDNGIGFDMKFTDRIFDIFQRLHRAEDYPGTGIGLAIVRKAMERMNGRVRAESAPGKGAAFYLEIPLHNP
jgi:PAS domain S-box-containing protein